MINHETFQTEILDIIKWLYFQFTLSSCSKANNNLEQTAGRK